MAYQNRDVIVRYRDAALQKESFASAIRGFFGSVIADRDRLAVYADPA